MPSYTYADIAKMIDHSLLNPTLSERDLEAGCRLAVDYDVATVCVMPYFLPRAVDLLRGSAVGPGTTVGFPHGGHTTETKLAEARQALDAGATELDMVVNVSKVRGGDWAYVRAEIAALTELTHARGARIKVIFENCHLDDPMKIALCHICGELDVDWVKTSTGYGGGGATIEDLKLMRRETPAHIQVKAAGGIRDLDALLAVRELGVTRLGASATKAMLDEVKRRLGTAAAAE
jgi:deoxyribose-phosphate aldolase